MSGHDNTGTPWSRIEVEALVADYLDMLLMELRREPFVKAAHNRALASRLAGRSHTSIERKHQNVSAVLMENQLPWIEGYKPFRHYQHMLIEVVRAQVSARPELMAMIEAIVDRRVTRPEPSDILSVEVAPPTPIENGPADHASDQTGTDWRDARGIKLDYFSREASNRALGLAGEEFVVAFEQERLSRAGAEQWAGKVEHVAQSRGDGLGFDVLSYETSGMERLIEVKTTRFGKLTPFFVSSNEVSVSSREADHYQMYRLYRFGEEQQAGSGADAKLFRLQGALEHGCSLDPTSYRATLK